MSQDAEKIARRWFGVADGEVDFPAEWYCETRDIFQARLERMTRNILQQSKIEESLAYTLVAIIGEIGNNSFDHNLGNWPDVPGILFCFDASSDAGVKVVLADRGQGVWNTLRAVKPELQSDSEALMAAFTEKISGRAPENRGNGLKFVRAMVQENEMKLTFLSGRAKIEVDHDLAVSESGEEIKGSMAILEA